MHCIQYNIEKPLISLWTSLGKNQMPWTWKDHASTNIPNLDFFEDQIGLFLGCNGAIGWDVVKERMEKLDSKVTNHAKTQYIIPTHKLYLLTIYEH